MGNQENLKLCRDTDAFIFDIDGTLLNTRDLVHYNALNAAMREVYGANTTIDAVPYHGMTDLSILRASLAMAGVSDSRFEEKLVEALAVVRQQVERNAAELKPEVCPGVPELLKRLKEEEKIAGVASGNLETVGWRKIESAGLREFFSFGFFSDPSERRATIFQNAVEAAEQRRGPGARVCFIGDTPADIEAAREVGAKIISVCTGTYSREQLAALSPDACVNSCDELLARL